MAVAAVVEDNGDVDDDDDNDDNDESEHQGFTINVLMPCHIFYEQLSL